MKEGYIYILINASLQKNTLKIGMTRRTPEIRAEEMSQETGLPSEYMVVHERKVSDCKKAEALIHVKLDRYRITHSRYDRSREFFVVPLKIAISVVNEIADQFKLEIPHTEEKKADDKKTSMKMIDENEAYPSYYSNGIVKDLKTGLEWLAGPDKDTNWDEAKSWVAGLDIGGSGWRMPTVDELEGIYEKGLSDRNITPLLKTTGWWVWSGETKGSSNAWSFNFGGSGRGGNGRSFSKFRRAFAVRSRNEGKSPAVFVPDKMQIQGHYAAIGNNIVKDTKTGLEWIAGPDKDTNWDEAKSWVAGLDIGDGGWRMPTVNELAGIYERGLGDRNMTHLLETTGWWVWSGETDGSSGARGFYFIYGGRDSNGRNNTYCTRAFAVRSPRWMIGLFDSSDF